VRGPARYLGGEEALCREVAAVARSALPEQYRGALRVEIADGRRKTSRCGARREQIRPRADLVLHSDPARRPVWWAIR
jgi:hypothetical protein